MKKSSARKLHRSLAWVMAFGLIYLTLSGVLLNHSKSLDLHNIQIKNAWLLEWYGQSAPAISQSFAINQHWISRINQNIYWDDKALSLQGEIQQILSHDSFVFIRLDKQIAFLSDAGELIDLIPLPEDISKASESRFLVDQQQINLLNNDQAWSLNKYFTEFVINPDYQGSLRKSEIPKTTEKALPEVLKGKLLALSPSNLTLEKVILELHNGYFLGPIGPWLLDLFALLILMTIISGIRLHRKN
jgi:hypothetical protein